MKEIGGYFELELPKTHDFPNSDGILVNSGRHALVYILKSIGQSIKRVWIPHYTCDVVFEQLYRNGIDVKYYSIDENFEITDDIKLIEGEYLIVNNYWGIKDLYVSKLAKIFKNRVIIDNAQAFFCPAVHDANYIYSPRKFLGVPDGGIAISTSKFREPLLTGYSYSRCSHLLKRIDDGAESGYTDFKTNSSLLKNEPLTKMSNLTKRLLGTIDYDEVRLKRRANFNLLHQKLSSVNDLKLPIDSTYACPMVYPYMTSDPGMRKKLIDNKIFVAKYWPNVLRDCLSDSFEFKLASNILPLPIDQRYDCYDMQRIVDVILK